MSESPDVYAHPCPTCSAEFGETCRTMTGKPRKPHAARLVDAGVAYARTSPALERRPRVPRPW